MQPFCKKAAGALQPRRPWVCRIWSTYIFIYIDKHIYMPIASFDGPLLGFSKARSRGKDEKLRQERGKDEKEDKTLKRGMPPHLAPSVGVLLGHFLL